MSPQVCDGLPRALAKLGHRVMTIAPRYDQYYDAWDTEFTAEVPMGDTTTTVRFFHAFKKGVDRVFDDHPLFLEKVWGLSKQKLYGPKWGKDYEDNQLRFAMFCKAAMIATEKLSLGGFPAAHINGLRRSHRARRLRRHRLLRWQRGHGIRGGRARVRLQLQASADL